HRFLFFTKRSSPSATDVVDIDHFDVSLPAPTMKRKKKTLRLHVWDFGGQEVYQTSHPFFMSSTLMFVLVWNVRSDNSSKLRHWIDLIHSLHPRYSDDDKIEIIVVATHADQL